MNELLKVGDEVEHYDGGNGSGNARCYGARGVIIRIGYNTADLEFSREVMDRYTISRSGGPWTLRNLRKVSREYSPEQAGDTEEDI